MNHWETHLYSYAVALTQGDKIKPKNLAALKKKAINHGHSEQECRLVETHTNHYIANGLKGLSDCEESRSHQLCAVCGSTNVRADAFAEWDADQGIWALHSTYDETHCESCSMQSSLIEIDEATQLEIQAFGMVQDCDGSRIAEGHETPGHFDIAVTTTPFESGVILTVEEHDDLSAVDAARVLAEVVARYPLAAITSINCDLGAVI